MLVLLFPEEMLLMLALAVKMFPLHLVIMRILRKKQYQKVRLQPRQTLAQLGRC